MLQSPQGLGIPAFPSGILPLMEVKIPQQAFPWRHAKDPRRNLQSLAVRYFICLVEGRRKLREGLGFGLILNVIQSQEESGATVPGTSEEKRASEPALGQEGPGPVAPSLAKQQIEWSSGETGPMPSSTQGEPTQKAPSTEASHGGDLGSGLKHRTEVRVGDVLCRIKMSSLHLVSSLSLFLLWSGSNAFALCLLLCHIFFFLSPI